MTGPTRRAFLYACGPAAAAVAGCAGLADDEPDTPGSDTPSSSPESPTATATPTREPTPAPAARGSVGMGCHDEGDNEYYFQPGLVWVEPGAEVTWGPTTPCRQRTVAFHPANDRPLRIPEGAEPWASPALQGTDRSFHHTFEREGVYNYGGLHEAEGQVGIVLVGRPDLDGQPGMTDPGEELPEAARERLRELIDRVRDLLG